MDTKKLFFKHLFLLITLLMTGVNTIMAADGDTFTDGVLIYTINGNNATVSGADSQYNGVIDVPESVTHEGVSYTVNCIGSGAFCGKTFGGISLPSSITTIEQSAFYIHNGKKVVVP